MSDTKALIAELRDIASHFSSDNPYCRKIVKAADALERLSAMEENLHKYLSGLMRGSDCEMREGDVVNELYAILLQQGAR